MSITTPSSVPLNLLKKMLIGRRDALKNLGIGSWGEKNVKPMSNTSPLSLKNDHHSYMTRENPDDPVVGAFG